MSWSDTCSCWDSPIAWHRQAARMCLHWGVNMRRQNRSWELLEVMEVLKQCFIPTNTRHVLPQQITPKATLYLKTSRIHLGNVFFTCRVIGYLVWKRYNSFNIEEESGSLIPLRCKPIWKHLAGWLLSYFLIQFKHTFLSKWSLFSSCTGVCPQQTVTTDDKQLNHWRPLCCGCPLVLSCRVGRWQRTIIWPQGNKQSKLKPLWGEKLKCQSWQDVWFTTRHTHNSRLLSLVEYGAIGLLNWTTCNVKLLPCV